MLKRSMDLMVSSAVLLIFSPLLLLLAGIIRIKLGAPIFFCHVRPGLHAQPFKMIKFRSMTDEIGMDGQPLPDAQRLTAFGRWLRATSLDELPGLWNVLKGDMSLVGPRPLLVEYLPLYNEEQRRRHDVRPGITGWAQVNGRNAVSWDEKFQLDIWYVKHASLWLDIKILIYTVQKVFIREGIHSVGHVTMEKFTGIE